MSRAAATVGTRIAPAGDGFVTTRTLSGRSLGSLNHYSMDWNAADMGEVSSGNPQPTPHPAGPSALAQKMHQVKVAVIEADKTAGVIILSHSF